MQEIRRGTKKATVNGEMYQHHDIWVSPFVQSKICKLSEEFSVGENVIISQIVEDFLQSSPNLESVKYRISRYIEDTIPKVRAKKTGSVMIL